MPGPNPRPSDPRPSPEPDDDRAAWLGERTRRLALGLTAALISARFYWPSEPDFKADAGTGLDWVLAILFVTALAIASALIGGRLRLRLSWTDAAVVVLMLLVGMSVSGAIERRAAINLAWEWAGLGLAYLLVRNLPRTPKESAALAGVLVATAVAVAVYGLYQVGVELREIQDLYRRNPDRALRQLGIAPGTPAQKLFEDRLLGSSEPWSTFALANSLAGFLVGPLVVMLAVWWDNLCHRLKDSQRRWALLMALPPILAVLVCLILTKSRSAYLGLVVALAVLAWRSRGGVSRKTLALTAVGGLALVAALVVGGLATGRLDRLVLLEAPKSLRYRGEYWVGAWRVIHESPRRFWSGHGPGNFAAPYLRHKLPQSSEEIVDPHDMVLEVWAAAGVWGALALISALGLGLWNTLGPARPPQPEHSHDHRSRPPLPSSPHPSSRDPSAPPERVGWLVAFGGGGWVAVVLLGRFNPFEPDLFTRWLILGAAWLLAVWLGLLLWRRLPIAAAGPGAAALAVMVNLLAAGGIGIAGVALALWTLIALGLNLREDRPCGPLRDAGGRVTAFVLAAIWAALIGTFAGSVGPFWEMEQALADAATAIEAKPPDYAQARAAYQRAIRADRLSARPWLGLADLEYRAWLARGAKPDDLAWKTVPVALIEAVKAPRSSRLWTVHRDRAAVMADILDRVGEGLKPMERIRYQGNIVEAIRTATLLYPSNPTLHARLADASAEIGMTAEAAKEAREALRLDRLTPHLDKKLPPALRKRIEAKLPEWEKSAPEPKVSG